jgi:hypothetical protein
MHVRTRSRPQALVVLPAALWAAQLRGLQRIAGACREVASSM